MSSMLFSLTAKDFRWETFRGSGAGGQKRNKTSSGVRCTHEGSGSVGKSDDTRSQHQNRRIAFERCVGSDKFKAWHKIECARMLGEEQRIKDRVEEQMRPWNIKVETFDPAQEDA